MSEDVEHYKNLRLEAAAQSLGLTRDETKALILKQVNRGRFFLQEAVDKLSPESRAEVELSETNILVELHFNELSSVFAEQREVFRKVSEALALEEHPQPERELVMGYFRSYIETLAILNGLTQTELMKRSIV